MSSKIIRIRKDLGPQLKSPVYRSQVQHGEECYVRVVLHQEGHPPREGGAGGGHCERDAKQGGAWWGVAPLPGGGPQAAGRRGHGEEERQGDGGHVGAAKGQLATAGSWTVGRELQVLH